MGFFKKISNSLKKTREVFSKKLDYVFSNNQFSQEFFDELTDVLISSDIGYKTSEKITEELRKNIRENKIKTPEKAKEALKEIIRKIVENHNEIEINYPASIMMIGVNGVGKTTTIGKLANYFKKENKQVVLVAGDTFRAGATEQLSIWALKNKVKIVKHNENADAGAVVFDAVSSAKAKNIDVLLIDTAGRLHTKTNLMQELEKIDKIVDKNFTNAHKYTFLVIDATTGQNAIAQFNAFNEFVKIDAIILTKLDGTAKGGVIIEIINETKIPVLFATTGEKLDDIEQFDAKSFAENLF